MGYIFLVDGGRQAGRQAEAGRGRQRQTQRQAEAFLN
jgi:hypothetical protein